MIIGTHFLIAEEVEFSLSRMAVVDEQQCFSVVERRSFIPSTTRYLFASNFS